MPSPRATAALYALAFAGCAYDWSLPDGGPSGPGGAAGDGGGREGGGGSQGGGLGGAGGGPCKGDVTACVQALCGDLKKIDQCARRECRDLTAQACAAVVCGEGPQATDCATKLCINFGEFCRDYK
jgi:hypothetical protein